MKDEQVSSGSLIPLVLAEQGIQKRIWKGEGCLCAILVILEGNVHFQKTHPIYYNLTIP